MDRQLIQSLIAALTESGLAELEYSTPDATLRLVRHAALGDGYVRTAEAPVQPARSEPALPPVTAPITPPPAASAPAGPAEIAAPLYGVVHLGPSPGAAPFVQPGEAVQAGAVLCLVEAMKAFTELRAPADARVLAVLVRTGQEVDAGQPLFRLG